MPFVKLDTGILHSTVWADVILSRVFLASLLMAEPYVVDEPTPSFALDASSTTAQDYMIPPGRYGLVPAADVGILREAGFPGLDGHAALARLCSPEPNSRSPEHGGRRMARISGGFLILNYAKYRDKDNTRKERQRRFREAHKGQKTGPVTPLSPHVTPLHNGIVTKGREQRAEAEEEGGTPLADARNAVTDPTEWEKQEEEEIPEGMATLQYACFILDRCHIPAGYALKVKTGDAIAALAGEELCSMPEATRRLLARMRAALPDKPRWLFWLEDRAWAQARARAIAPAAEPDPAREAELEQTRRAIERKTYATWQESCRRYGDAWTRQNPWIGRVPDPEETS
jgi:hypothetical protein